MKRRLGRSLALFGALAVLSMAAPSALATHPRPRGAGPIYMSLVPAYSQCTAPNRTHGPPLESPSCSPPTQSSAHATVGTPDAFGGAANATSYLRLATYLGVPGPPDEADILIMVDLDDLRCIPTGPSCGSSNASGPADYSGEMRFSFTFRLTDHFNATAPGGESVAATLEDFATEFAWACSQSESTSTGSTCKISTSVETFFPGAVPESKRAIWELGAARIYDGGTDGDADTTADNTIFLRSGAFVP